MSDLQDALDYWSGMEEMSTCDRRHLRRIVDAARRVANPDYKAAGNLIHTELCIDHCIDWHDGKAIVDAALGISE